MGALRGSTRSLAFVKIAILARLLPPEQFGVFGVATLALAFLEIITETGINVFLVQEEEDIKDYLNTAWIVSIIRGFLIAALIIILAPYISLFFNSPKSLNIIYLVSLVPFIRGFINPSIVKFQKNLEFNKEFLFRFVIYFFDALVAVYLGFVTRSALSLVYGLIAGSFLEVILSFVFVKPLPVLAFEIAKIKKVTARGKWLTAAGLFNYLFQEGDDIVVGKLLNTGALGLYQVAYKISTLPVSEVGEIANKVTFPIYVRIQKDRERLKKAFLKVTLVIAILVIPFGLILFVFPQPIIKFLLGEQWLEIVPVFRVLALFGILRALSGSAYSVYLAVKKQEYATGVTFIGFLGLAVTIIPFVKNYGIIGAAYSALAGLVLSIPLVIYYLRKIFKYEV